MTQQVTSQQQVTTPASPELFLAAMRRQVTTVTVVTAHHEQRPWGMTVSAFTSVCAEPPTVLVCVNQRTILAAAIAATGRFGANLLSRDQEFLSRLCARPGTSKYLDDYCLPATDTHAPVLQDSLTTLDCVLTEAQQVGSHQVLFGRVATVLTPPQRRPLLYGEGRYHETVDVGQAGWATGEVAWM